MFNKAHDSRIIFQVKKGRRQSKKTFPLFLISQSLTHEILLWQKILNKCYFKAHYSGPDKSTSTVSELQPRSKDTEIEPQAFIIYPRAFICRAHKRYYKRPRRGVGRLIKSVVSYNPFRPIQ